MLLCPSTQRSRPGAAVPERWLSATCKTSLLSEFANLPAFVISKLIVAIFLSTRSYVLIVGTKAAAEN